MPAPLLRRIVYYGAALAGVVLVHQRFVATLLGTELTSVLRRNNEAYLMLLIIPAYWDVFAAPADPDGAGATAPVDGRWVGQATWFGGVVLAAVALQSGLLEEAGIVLAPAIATLGEAFVAAVVICGYLGWSRAILPGRSGHAVTGAAVVPAATRAVYYAAVVLVAVAAQQSWVADLLGGPVVDWLKVNVEAYAAMLLVPLYYDVVAPSRQRWVRPAWYAFLVAAPVAVQGRLLDGIVADPLLAWLGRTTEAFIATFVVSAYIDWWRGRWSGHHTTSAAQPVGGGR